MELYCGLSVASLQKSSFDVIAVGLETTEIGYKTLKFLTILLFEFVTVLLFHVLPNVYRLEDSASNRAVSGDPLPL